MFKSYFSKMAVTATIICSLSGCVESSFELSSESRLPRWFDVPKGMSRDELRVTVDYYSTFSGGEAVFKLYDKNGTRLKKIEGETGVYPLQLKQPPQGSPKNYPMYEIVEVDGVKDIIEHRGRNNVFYMTDDPAIWNEFGVKQ